MLTLKFLSLTSWDESCFIRWNYNEIMPFQIILSWPKYRNYLEPPLSDFLNDTLRLWTTAHPANKPLGRIDFNAKTGENLKISTKTVSKSGKNWHFHILRWANNCSSYYGHFLSNTHSVTTVTIQCLLGLPRKRFNRGWVWKTRVRALIFIHLWGFNYMMSPHFRIII